MKALWSRFHTELRFVAALAVGAAYSDVASKAGRRRIWRALAVWTRIAGRFGRDKVAPHVYRWRLEACEKCPIFYARLRTCGTPLDPELKDFGCWCQMDVKAKHADATCWLDDDLGEDALWGWKANGIT